MCGIAGVFISSHQSFPIIPRLKAMEASLQHRGPDSGGVWADTTIGIGLAHRRLSIVDPSTFGSQPILSGNGRFVAVYNGEIYNHLALRKLLEQDEGIVAWKSQSDSETLVECIAAWGIQRTLKSIVGMFAFAVWDKLEGALLLARDRIGEKPLYYGQQRGVFVFSSELVALREVPEFELSTDSLAVNYFLRLGYVPDPFSIYSGVNKLPPGTWVKIMSTDLVKGTQPPPTTYWSFSEVALSGQSQTIRFDSPDDPVVQLENLLATVVRDQLMSDVPIGAFLSGGIDSSIITSLMQRNSSRAIDTFSIGFEDERYDETSFASTVSRELGTKHHSLIVTDTEAANLIPHLAGIYDEPFADRSQIPTYLLAKLARTKVSVALSGDGGDELFAGYERYSKSTELWKKVSPVPRSTRALASRTVKKMPASVWDIIGRIQSKHSGGAGNSGQRAEQLSRLLECSSHRDVYNNFISISQTPTRNSAESDMTLFQQEAWLPLPDEVHQAMAFDAVTYLPGDILVKVDRATMSHGLESRMPFLDHRLIEFAWKLPLSLKKRKGADKWILRRLFERLLPTIPAGRPKMGFGIPVSSLLRTSLKDWASDLLSPSSICIGGFLDPEYVTELWNQHLSGSDHHEARVWRLLMFQSWVENERQPRITCNS